MSAPARNVTVSPIDIEHESANGVSQSDDAAVVLRSAENWFLDAAVFARDGDHEHAIEATVAGIAAIRGTGHA